MSGCVHRWRLGEQNGQTFISGTCSRCGARRDNFRLASQCAGFKDWRLERDPETPRFPFRREGEI